MSFGSAGSLGRPRTGAVRGKVEVFTLEVSGVANLAPIGNCHVTDRPSYVAACLECLERSVDVHAGQAGAVSKLLLRHRQLVRELCAEARRFKPNSELTQEMRDPRRSIAARDVGYPLPKDRSVNERVTPHRHANVWKSERNLLDRFARDEGHVALSQRLHTVVGNAEQRVLKIDHVAAHMNGADGPPSIGNELLAERKPRNEQTRASRPVAVANNICACFHPLDFVWQRANGVRLFRIQRHPLLELPQEWL